MASIVTTGTAFPGTTVNLNSNTIAISMGNSLSISAGMSNSIFLGAKTSLTVGAATNITLGPSSSYTWGAVLSSTYGPSWSWSGTNNTIYDSASRWGVLSNTYNGGISAASYLARWTETQQGRRVALAVVASYVVLVGLSLLGIQYPPFKMTGKDDNNNATGVEVDDRNACITMITDSLGVILLALGQYFFVKYLWNWRNFLPVTTLGLTSSGLSSYVYADSDNSATSPFANFMMKPGTETVPGAYNSAAVPYVGYISDSIPVISLTSSLAPATNTSTTLTINPSGVIITSTVANGGPQISFNTANNGSVTISNNTVTAAQAGSVTITDTQTEISRTQGTILLSQGTNPNTSQLNLGAGTASLQCNGGNGSGAIVLTPNNVTIGTGNAAAQFSSAGVTIGGAQGVVVSNSTITIGGALVVQASGLNASITQAITTATQQVNQAMALGNQLLQEQLLAANQTILQLRADILSLQRRTTFNERDLQDLRATQLSGTNV